MKRSTYLYTLLALLFAIFALFCYMVPQQILNNYEYSPLVELAIIPMGWLWIWAFVEAKKGN